MQIAQPPTTPTDEPEMMTWLDHLIELRNRLFKVCVAVLIGLIVGFFVVQYNNYALITYTIQYFAGQNIRLQAIAPTENFTNVIQIALGMGIAFAMPVIVYQLMAFIVPGLTTRERRIIFLILPFITLLFIAGLMFGWFVTVPAAMRWLLNFGPSSIEVRPTFDTFSSFFIRLMLINGVIFELPVVVYSLIWLGAVERKTLAKYRRYAILVITIVAAIVTPTPDPINLALVAIPMYLLYELGLLLALLAPRKQTVVAGS